MSNLIAFDLLPYQSGEMSVGAGRLRYIDVGPGGTRPRDSGLGSDESREAATNGAATGLEADGAGKASESETILCVHGNPTWSFYWRRVLDRFGATHRVVAVDHIGCGRSDKPSRDRFDYTLASHRNNLVALIDHLNLRKITLLAHDWGGAIGLSAVLERLDRLDRVILLNTGAFPPPYVPLRIAACRIPVLGTGAVRGFNLFARAAVRMAMSRQKLSETAARGLLAPYDSWGHRVAIDSFVRDIPMTRRHPTYRTLRELESRLPELAAFPALLVWGMKDWCFRPECLNRFRELWPDCEWVEISDAGHYVMEDAPEEVLAAIADFVESSGMASSGMARGSIAANHPRDAAFSADSTTEQQRRTISLEREKHG